MAIDFPFFFKVVYECDFCAMLTNFEPQLEILWIAFLREFEAFEGKVSAKSEVETNLIFCSIFG